MDWITAKLTCTEFGMDLARFELSEETSYIFGVLQSYGTGSILIHVDKVTVNSGQTAGWYWGKTRFPTITYPILWRANDPDTGEFCLDIYRDGTGSAGSFASVDCSGDTQRFMCQTKHENFFHRLINSQGFSRSIETQ